MADLKYVIDRGMLVAVKSQCPYEGSDLTLYETGRMALEAGVFQAYDMSTEALVTKLMWLLGRGWGRKRLEEAFYQNLAGEIRIPSPIPV